MTAMGRFAPVTTGRKRPKPVTHKIDSLGGPAHSVAHRSGDPAYYRTQKDKRGHID
jgi:hypothetical protein